MALFRLKRLRVVLAVVAGGGLMVVAVPSQPGLAAAVPQLAGPHVIHYTTTIAPNATVSILQGKELASGTCQFTIQGEAKLGNVQLQGREVAYDPSTCQSEIEQVNTTSSAAESPSMFGSPATTSSHGGSEGTEGSGGSGGSGAGGGQQPPNGPSVQPLTGYPNLANCNNPYYDSSKSYPAEACIWSWFQNPSGTHQGDMSNEVQWTPEGSCADTYYWNNSYAYQHAAGWNVSVGPSYDPSANCTDVESESGVTLGSATYCPGNTSSIGWAPQWVEGTLTTWHYNYTYTKTDPCSNLSFFYDANEGPTP